MAFWEMLLTTQSTTFLHCCYDYSAIGIIWNVFVIVLYVLFLLIHVYTQTYWYVGKLTRAG